MLADEIIQFQEGSISVPNTTSSWLYLKHNYNIRQTTCLEKYKANNKTQYATHENKYLKTFSVEIVLHN